MVILYLDFTTPFDSSVPAIANDGWGAVEIWLCGEGRLRSQMPLALELVDELQRIVCASNEKADAAIGPVKWKGDRSTCSSRHHEPCGDASLIAGRYR